jgi:hypothetical protein
VITDRELLHEPAGFNLSVVRNRLAVSGARAAASILVIDRATHPYGTKLQKAARG